MAPNIPTPPPPLPPIPHLNFKTVGTCKPPSSGSSQSSIIYSKIADDQTSAEQELQNAQNRLWELEGWKEFPILTVYQYLPSILQEGPQCGLVALAMASACIDQPISVEVLLKNAKLKGFSKHGEMFSVDNMASLAQTACPNTKVQIIDDLLMNQNYIIQTLARGGILLVPYDADRNHVPCSSRGHKAHWAAVSGALVCPDRCLVAARQGKSRRLMLWDYQQLVASNNNLVELSPSRSEDGNEYLLPPGGVKAGLCGRAVILLRY